MDKSIFGGLRRKVSFNGKMVTFTLLIENLLVLRGNNPKIRIYRSVFIEHSKPVPTVLLSGTTLLQQTILMTYLLNVEKFKRDWAPYVKEKNL